MNTLITTLNITETNRANLEAVQALSSEDQLRLLEVIMLGGLSITKEGLGFPVARATGPRGPGAKVLGRQAIVRGVAEAFITAGVTFSIVEMKDEAAKRYEHHDIQPVLDALVTEGRLTTWNKGRKQFWKARDEVEAAEPAALEVVLPEIADVAVTEAAPAEMVEVAVTEAAPAEMVEVAVTEAAPEKKPRRGKKASTTEA